MTCSFTSNLKLQGLNEWAAVEEEKDSVLNRNNRFKRTVPTCVLLSEKVRLDVRTSMVGEVRSRARQHSFEQARI